MKEYNFDDIIERKNTNSLKYDFAKERNFPEGILPYWVADMDFKTAPSIMDALKERCNHGIFGYTNPKADYYKIVQDWFKHHFNFTFEKDCLVITPGVVFAICTAIRSLTNEGDSVIIQQPVYYPFASSITNNNRNLVVNSLVYKNGAYSIDFDDFEQKIITNNVKLFILCNPHNPVGRVWTNEELIKLGDICCKHNVLVVSDEIHCDFVRSGYTHIPFASIKDEFNDISITCTSPSKTFNLAGLQISNIFISNESLRTKFKSELSKIGYDEPSTLGLVACMAAYKDGEAWLNELKGYLEMNITKFENFIKEYLPQIKLVNPEGTYLLWLDFSALGLSDDELNDLIVNKANLWLDKGTMFGVEGSGFQRINIACPWSLLETALINIQKVMN